LEIEGFAVEHAGFVGDRLMLVATRSQGDGWLTRVLACTLTGESCEVVDEQPVGGQEYDVPNSAVLSSPCYTTLASRNRHGASYNRIVTAPRLMGGAGILPA
jgi:hypothetical protein